MPEEGTDARTPPPTAPADPFLDPLTRHRTPVGYALAALAAAFLAAGGYCFYKAFPDAPAAETKADETLKLDLPEDGKDSGTKLQRPYTNEYILGGVVGLICALASGAAGGWLLGSLPTAKPADRLADRRDDQRIEDVDERARIAPDRALRGLLHSGRQHVPQPRVARRLGDCGWQDASDRRCEPLGILHHIAQPRQHFDLSAEHQGK